jgi:hypothetical protein
MWETEWDCCQQLKEVTMIPKAFSLERAGLRTRVFMATRATSKEDRRGTDQEIVVIDFSGGSSAAGTIHEGLRLRVD